MAQKAESSPEYISLLESEKRLNPSARLLARIATALAVSCDYLRGEAGWLPSSDQAHRRLSPEVQRLQELLSEIADSQARYKAFGLLADAAETMRDLAEADAGLREARPDQETCETLSAPAIEPGYKPFCTRCGGKRDEADIFCGWCGHKLNGQQ